MGYNVIELQNSQLQLRATLAETSRSLSKNCEAVIYMA